MAKKKQQPSTGADVLTCRLITEPTGHHLNALNLWTSIVKDGVSSSKPMEVGAEFGVLIRGRWDTVLVVEYNGQLYDLALSGTLNGAAVYSLRSKDRSNAYAEVRVLEESRFRELVTDVVLSPASVPVSPLPLPPNSRGNLRKPAKKKTK